MKGPESPPWRARRHRPDCAQLPELYGPAPEPSISHVEPVPSDAALRRQRLLLLLAIGAIAIVRLVYCARLPVNTGDLLRHVHTALYVLRDGLSVAGVPLVELDPGLAGLSWARVSYSYPPLVLPFFTAVAALSPTLFAAKLALTLIEAANAALVARITSSRWLGVIYWASPASIWWVSGEGQFEPLMAFFMLGAVRLARRSPVAAFTLIALGFHVKLTAILLLPWLVVTTRREAPDRLPGAAAAFGVAMVAPVVLAGLWYPVLEGLLGISSTLRYNPYHWNVFDPAIFLWNPGWLRAVNALASYGVLGFMLVYAARRAGSWIELGGAISFVALIKLSSLAQFWYFVLFPAFIMPAESGRGRVRWWLVALTPLLDVRSSIQLLIGPFGWVDVGIYEGLSAFTPFGVR